MSTQLQRFTLERIKLNREINDLKAERDDLKVELENCRDDRNKEMSGSMLIAYNNMNAAAVHELTAEVTRLRAALETLANYDDVPYTAQGSWMRKIAREALEKMP